MKQKLIFTLAVVAFILAIAFSTKGFSSTNDLPASVGGTVSVSSNGLISAPAGFLSTNGLALNNPPVMIYDEGFSGWGTADGITWTNAQGWTSTAVVTNGIATLTSGSVISPWLSNGLAAVYVSWSNLVMLAGVMAYTTNDLDWITLSSGTDLRLSVPVRVKLAAELSGPPIGDPVALLDRVILWSHQFPSRIGSTNDFAGIVIRVDNPVGTRDAVNLQTLESRLAAYVMGGESAERWSQFPASNTVNLAGQTLQLDTRYALSVIGDTVALSMSGATLLEIIGANTCTPRIVSFQLAGTNISAEVVGITGWRPYPQWSASLVTPSWTTLDTNQFTSTYPEVTNGLYRLSWSVGTNSTEFWRITARDESGGTNGAGLATFHCPVNVPQLFVAGRELSPYTPVTASNADYAAVAGYASVAGSAAYSSNSGSAGYAAVSAYANTAGSATTATRADSSRYATNCGLSTTSTYATNAGYATSSGYAAGSGVAAVSGVSTQGIIGGVSRTFGTAAASGSNDFPRINQSNVYGIWTTQQCDHVELLSSTITTNSMVITNLIVSGSADPSPNGIYYQYGADAWTAEGYSNERYFYHVSHWGIRLNTINPPAYWTNATFLGDYYPFHSNDGSAWTNSGVAVVSIYNIATNFTYTTNRSVRLRLNQAGIEFQGTNAVWRAMDAVTGILTNSSGIITQLVTSTIRYLGAP